MTSTLIALLLSAVSAGGGSGQVRGSPHDLTRGTATTSALPAAPEGGGACAFCHASHGAGAGLSSRTDPSTLHVPYASGSMAARPGAPSFGDALGQALGQVEALQQAGDAQATAAANGQGNLHELSMSLEKADIAMRVAAKVRNKLVEAYQEVMRMPV